MDLLQKLRSEHPLRDVAVTAVETLKDKLEIIEFFNQYVNDLKDRGIIENTESIAGTNIGYVLKYCDKKTAYIWAGAIPSVILPFFE